MKKLKHIINWTIWSLLALYVTLIALLHLPFIQSWLGQQVAGVLSKKIGTTVTVGRVDLGFMNRLIIDDVTIDDQQHCEMIKAGRMSVKVDLLPLLEGRISISSAQLFGAQLTLRRDSASATPNYQFLLDSLASKNNEPKKPLDIRLNSLIIRNSTLSYDQLDAATTPHQLNPRHLAISDISAHIVLKTLTDDSLNLSIKRLAFREQSGLAVNKLALKVEANRERALLSGFTLQMPHSTLSLDTLSAVYDMDHIDETLIYDGRLSGNMLMPSDFSSLYPPLRNMNHHLDVDIAFSGTAKRISCPTISIVSDDRAVVLKASAAASNTNGNNMFDATFSDMYLGQTLLSELEASIEGMPAMVGRLGFVSMNGTISGQPDIVSTQSNIRTGSGSLLVDGAYKPTLHEFNGHLVTDSLDIGLLTADSRLGRLSTTIDISGNEHQMAVQGTVDAISYNGYSYRDIQINGNYANGDIIGHLTVDDPNIYADIEGLLAHDNRYTLQLTGTIDHFTPQALHLSDHWGEAAFSAIVNADFTASSLADAEGELSLRHFEMTAPDSLSYPYYLDHLTVSSGYDNEKLHYISIDGDFGDAELRGNFDLQTLPQSFANYIASRLPTLPGLPATTRPTTNDFTVNMHLVNSDWIQQLIGIPLNLNNSPLTLYAEVSDRNSALDIKGTLPEFTYKDSPYRNSFLHIATRNDSTICSLNLTKLLKNDRKVDLQLTAHASNNSVSSRLTFDNSDLSGDSAKAMYGTVNTITQLYTNDDGKPEAHIRILPSRIMLKGTAWEMEPSDILYADKQLLVDHFTIRHGHQHLIIDGMASNQDDDSLMVDLNDLEVGYLLELVNFRSVRFAGPATGRAYVTGLFGDMRAWGDITIPDFLFQDGHMGALNAHTMWNNEAQRIDLNATIATDTSDSTFVNGYISPVDKELDLTITAHGSPIGFVHSFLQSFIGDITGHANGMLRVHGPLKQLLLTGDMAVDGRATIKPLGTTYTLRNDTVHFRPNNIVFDRFQAFDRDGRAATLNGTVSHRYLKHFTFTLGVDANRTLVYDFPTFNGGTVCGTVYADGHATINGKPGEVVIDCEVTPTSSSVFGYNAANPDAVNRQQFITWSDATQRNEAPSAARSVTQPTAATTSKPSSDVYINFRINASPDATLRLLMDQGSGDQITLNGTGMLRASYHNKGPFQMFGTYNVERGTYSMTIQNIIKKNFTFQQGSTIVFSGDPFGASLNLKATHTVNGVSLSDLNIGNSFTRNTIRVNCLMNILGTAGTPRVEFDLEMPTVNNEEEQMIRSIIASEQELNQQVVYLLGIGRFYTQGSNNAGTQSYGQTELAMQSLLSGTVSTQINEILSQVIKNDDWNFGANISTGNEGWHNAEYEGLVSGRMLNNRLLINGQFGYRDNATTTAPSFIGDFDISYLLLPNGNLSLKVYNQTNDRYFTHSSLNTQGIGLVMKKDFNGLRELLYPRRKKTKN